MNEINRETIIRVYTRIRNAAKSGKGVRLSAEECGQIWYGDRAIEDALDSVFWMDNYGSARLCNGVDMTIESNKAEGQRG